MKKTLSKNTKLFFPEKELTGDNSIMIGIAGYLQYIKNKGKVVARRKMFNWLYAGKSVYNNTGESHATKV